MSENSKPRSSSSDDTAELKLRGELVVGLCTLYTKHLGADISNKISKAQSEASEKIQSLLSQALPSQEKRERANSTGNIGGLGSKSH
jgi:hypothetical protein